MMTSTDKPLPENRQENLDPKRDQGTSQRAMPPSARPTDQGTTENLVRQATETLGRAATAASDTAREAFGQGQRYVSEARERYPEAARYYREGTRTVRQYAAENPLVTLLVGAGIGYVLAWALQAGGSDEGERVPDYAKTRRGYYPHRPQPRA